MSDTILYWASLASPIVIALVAATLAVLLLWIGLRLLIWPFRFAFRRLRFATHAVHPAGYVAALVISIILVPQPFNYILGMFVDLVRLLTGDLPKLILTAAQAVSNVCAGPTAVSDKCAFVLVDIFQSAWSGRIGTTTGGPIGRWVGNLQIPPMWEWAVFTFSVSLAGAWLIQRATTGAQSFWSPNRTETHAVIYTLVTRGPENSWGR